MFRKLLGVLIAAAVLVTCTTEDPPVPTTINVTPANVDLDAVGATQQLSATVLDQDGNPLADATVSWSSDDQQVAGVSNAGLVTAGGNGTAMITASAGDASGQANVTVAQVPTAAIEGSGNNQSGLASTPLPDPMVVNVEDRLGNPVPDVAVTFVVTAGGGSADPASTTTNADGEASTVWTLGPAIGANELEAEIEGFPNVEFSATSVAGVATQIMIATADPQQAGLNSPVPDPPGVLILDQFDNPVPGIEVVFAVTSGGGIVTGSPATTGANGIAQVTEWQVGPSEGTNEVEATVVAPPLGPVTFTAEGLMVGAPTSVVTFDGQGQIGLTGAPINFPPAVQVLDINMLPVPDVEVVFAVTGGGGGVTDETQMTDENGVATVGSWTIEAGANTLDATVTGGGISGNPVSFDATGVSSEFAIDIMHVNAPTAGQASAFDAAVAFWEEALIGDLADGVVMLDADDCIEGQPAFNDVVDDLLIFSVLEPIDGAGGVLGQAGPCLIRGLPGLTIVGVMRFDTDDLDALEADGELDEVIRHEMGHVLGYGTLWGPQVFDLLRNPSLPNSPGVDTHLDGPLSIKTFDLVGGDTYTAGDKVPVENEQGGDGTRDGHWRESVFETELMTGFLNGGVPNPMSIVSIASLGDLGYVFNLSAADAYVLPAVMPAPQAAGTRIELVNDVWRGPLYVMDEHGRITATVRR